MTLANSLTRLASYYTDRTKKEHFSILMGSISSVNLLQVSELDENHECDYFSQRFIMLSVNASCRFSVSNLQFVILQLVHQLL